MNTAWLQQPWLETLGWTLVHSLWELSLVAAIAVILLLVMRRQSAQLRYVVGYGLLMAMMAVPVGTYAYLWVQQMRIATGPEISGGIATDFPMLASAPKAAMPHTKSLRNDAWQKVTECLQVLPPYAAIGYLAGAALLTLRLLAGYAALRQVRTGALPATQHETLLDQLRARLRLSIPVRLMLSARVEVPTVIGNCRPIILLPLERPDRPFHRASNLPPAP